MPNDLSKHVVLNFNHTKELIPNVSFLTKKSQLPNFLLFEIRGYLLVRFIKQLSIITKDLTLFLEKYNGRKTLESLLNLACTTLDSHSRLLKIDWEDSFNYIFLPNAFPDLVLIIGIIQILEYLLEPNSQEAKYHDETKKQEDIQKTATPSGIDVSSKNTKKQKKLLKMLTRHQKYLTEMPLNTQSTETVEPVIITHEGQSFRKIVNSTTHVPMYAAIEADISEKLSLLLNSKEEKISEKPSLSRMARQQNSQGIKMLSKIEKEKLPEGYAHKIKLLGSGGEFRLLGRVVKSTDQELLVIFDKIADHDLKIIYESKIPYKNTGISQINIFEEAQTSKTAHCKTALSAMYVILNNQKKSPLFKPVKDAIKAKNYTQALHIACANKDKNHIMLIEILLKDHAALGFDINEKIPVGSEKLAAVDHALKNQHWEAYEILLAYGAIPSKLDDAGGYQQYLNNKKTSEASYSTITNH